MLRRADDRATEAGLDVPALAAWVDALETLALARVR
jgi:hypothetical protein